jgi:hypothetical protein
LDFLGEGTYQAVLLNDHPDRPDALLRSENTFQSGDSIDIEMNEGGGFVGMFTMKQ